ncbi:MAG: hypothetical protein ACP5HK_02665 [Acidilobus sp.]
MIGGVYYEFIAVPCGSKVTMPLGLIVGQEPAFYVYKGTSLHERLADEGRLRLLSPYDPLAFLRSIRHELVAEIRWNNDCPVPEETMGAWYECSYRLWEVDENGKWFTCDGLQRITGSHLPYTRMYGCLVELLVLLTKARAGVWEDWYIPYAEGLAWCVRRSSRGVSNYVDAANEVLRELRSMRGGAKGLT